MHSQTLAELPEVLTIQECASFLRVGKNAIYAAVRDGRIRAVKLTGRRLLIPRRSLERFLSVEDAFATASGNSPPSPPAAP